MKKIFLALFVLLLFLASNIEARGLYWEKMTVDLYIMENSDLRVSEEMEYVFTGAWNGGQRSIDLSKVDDISDIQIWEGDKPYVQSPSLNKYEYNVDFSNKYLPDIKWRSRNVNEPPYDATHQTFTLKYTIKGAFGYFQKYDELYWKAIFEDRDGEDGTGNVNNALVRLHFPVKVKPAIGK